jgi:hypothetical protein
VQPPAEHPAVTGIWICLAQTPHFVLHLGKGFLCISLPCNQPQCHRKGYNGIVGEMRVFAQQGKILVLVIVVVKFIRTNMITISAGASGLLLSFCSAVVSCIMPQKASSSKTFCHKLPDFT